VVNQTSNYHIQIVMNNLLWY